MIYMSNKFSFLPVGHIRLNFSDHVYGSFIDFNEDCIVDLSESQQLKDFLHVRGFSVDTNIL